MNFFRNHKASKLIAAFMFALAIFVSDTAFAAQQTCTPITVEEIIGSRVVVRCATPLNGTNPATIFYLAISATSSAVNRFVSMAQAALLSGRNFVIDIPVSSATNVAGCAAGDCRTPTYFSVQN